MDWRHQPDLPAQEWGQEPPASGTAWEPETGRPGLRQSLVQAIGGHIIPRLVQARRLPRPQSGGPALRAEEVDEVVRLCLEEPAARLADHIRQRRNLGLPLERVHLELLAPAARRLGDLWSADDCDFVAVTLGMLRIQQLLCDLSPSFQDGALAPNGRRVLLAPVPFSQHTFGISMVADFFRQGGWDVSCHNDIGVRGLTRLLSNQRFDAVGLSVSSEGDMEGLRQLVSDIRTSSTNKGILVMLGGIAVSAVDALNAHPDVVSRFGADVIAHNAKDAVQVANQAVSGRAFLSA